MDFNSTTEFKVKRRPSHSIAKKQSDQKSETTKDNTLRNSLSRLKSTNNEDLLSQERRVRRPQRPLTGRNKQQQATIRVAEPEPTQPSIQLLPESQPMLPQLSSREVISYVLDQPSSRMKEFMARQNLSEFQVSTRLSDPLHLVSLDNFLVKNELVLSQAESYKKVERFLIHRLESDYEYDRQARACEGLEQRIQAMIDDRLKRLQQQL